MVLLSLSGSYSSVSSDRTHFYIAGDTGIDIINKLSQRSEGYVESSIAINDVWAEDNAFCFAATAQGLYRFEKPDQFKIGQDLSTRFVRDSRSDHFLSQEVLSLDGLSKSFLVAGTSSGVEVMNKDGIFHSSDLFPVTSVHASSDGDIFYGGEFGLANKRGPITSNWIQADIHVQAPFLSSTEVTSVDSITNENGDTVVGVSTASGITLIEKKTPFSISPTIKLFTSS